MQPPEYRLLHEFRYQIRRFLHFSEEAARNAGVEPRQHQLLLTVKAAEGALSVGDIAERLQLRHNTAVELIDRAADRGLVQRAADPTDRRRVAVTLTPEGDDLLEQLSAVHLQELRTAAPSLVAVLQQIVAAEGERARVNAR